MCMLLRRIFFTSGITDLCRSSSSSPWWASLNEPTACDTNCCTVAVWAPFKLSCGLGADFESFGAPSAPPGPKGPGGSHSRAGEVQSRSAPSGCLPAWLARSQTLRTAAPGTGTELDGSALIFYIYWRISHLISWSFTWYHSSLPHDLLISNKHTVRSTNLHGNLYKCGEVLFVSAVWLSTLETSFKCKSVQLH